MIIINSSIQKSGSTLIFRYQKDLIRLSERKNAQKRFNRYSYYGFVHRVNLRVFFIMLYIHLFHGDFVVKIHTGPTLFIRFLLLLKVAKATFSYRDPRDVILSAIDHGRKTRKNMDTTGAFIDFISIEGSIPLVKRWTRLWYQWKRFNHVLFIRYEEMMDDKMHLLRQIAGYLGYTPDDSEIDAIYTRHEKNKEKAWNFNKGTTYRYRTEMSPEDIQLCNEAFSDSLQEMGYRI